MTLKTRGGRDGALSMGCTERESVFEEKEGRRRDGARRCGSAWGRVVQQQQQPRCDSALKSASLSPLSLKYQS